MSSKLLLVGNPNVGKTTFFNFLTKSFEHTGNWHGVTTEAKEKEIFFNNKKITVVDLPGIYSLSSYSYEEQVAIDYLINNKSETIINVCDANVLQRNLYLTLQLIEMGLSTKLYVNFNNEIKNNGIEYDYKKLEKELNIKIFLNKKEKDKKQLKDIIEESICCSDTEINENLKTLSYLNNLPIQEILENLNESQKNIFNLPPKFIAIKILEKDENIIKTLNLTDLQKNKIDNILQKEDYVSKLSFLRYAYIENILNKSVKNQKDFVYGKFKIDKIILNKYLAFPIFLTILFLIFYITFSSVGAYLSSVLKNILDIVLGNPIKNFLIKVNSPAWIIGLFSVGIIESVGGLLSFIPQIVLLF